MKKRLSYRAAAALTAIVMVLGSSCAFPKGILADTGNLFAVNAEAADGTVILDPCTRISCTVM